MFSHTKFQINWTFVTYFLFSVPEDTGLIQQQSVKYEKKKEKKKRRKAIAKLFALQADAKKTL